MVQFSNEMIEKHAVPKFGDFKSAEIPDLSEITLGAEQWPSRYLFVATMDELTGKTIKSPQKQYGVNLLYRARNAALAYSGGREKTLQFLAEETGSTHAITVYFSALSKWEEVFSNVQKAFEIFQKGIVNGAILFTKGDGSAEERAYAIANSIKHDAAKTPSSAVGAGLPMWLTNAGFETAQTSLSWAELAEWVQELVKTANILMTPLYKLAAGDS